MLSCRVVGAEQWLVPQGRGNGSGGAAGAAAMSLEGNGIGLGSLIVVDLDSAPLTLPVKGHSTWSRA